MLIYFLGQQTTDAVIIIHYQSMRIVGFPLTKRSDGMRNEIKNPEKMYKGYSNELLLNSHTLRS